MAIPADQQIGEALDSLYRCIADEGHWDAALRRLSALFDTPRVAVLRASPRLDALFEMRSLNHDPETQRLYQQHYWALDPTHLATREAPAGRWLDCDRLLDPKTSPQREYVNDYAIPRGIRWVSGGKVHADSRSCTVLGLQRPADSRPFDTDSARVFAQIAPHLGRVTQLAADAAALRVRAGLARSAVDGFACAAFVVTPEGRLLLANAAAEAALVRGFPLSLRAGKLVLRDSHAQQERFALALHAACAAPARGEALLVGQAERWVVRVIPGSAHALPDSSPCALVFAAPAAPSRSVHTVLRQLFAFTVAEAEVAMRLAEGMNPKEIARTRDVSLDTVRSQVASVLRKAGVRRQVELVNLVASVPSLHRGDA